METLLVAAASAPAARPVLRALAWLERDGAAGGCRVAMARARLTLLDGFGLVCDGEAVLLPMTAQRVLAFVALHERPLHRLYVAGSLWLDSPEDRAYASLRSALWRLHRNGRRLVVTDGQQLALGPDVEVDLRESELLARRALDEADTDALGLDSSTLAADLLPDWYEDWVLVERERYRQLRLHALDTLCDRLTRADRLSEALVAGLAAVAGEPLRESAHRAVVRVHIAEGNGGEAIRQYRICRRLLNEQLAIEPSERMRELLRTLEAAVTAG
jgi:DNA-binding SARP family transcriptional activator